MTTVLNMSGTPRFLEWRERIRAGELLGPWIHTTGPQVKDSALPAIDTEATLPRGEDVAPFVAWHRELGYDFVKIWSSIQPYEYEAIAAECRRQGVRLTGHVPSRVGLRGVLASGQDSIAHVEELLNKFFVRQLDQSGFPALRNIVQDRELVVISTLITYEMIADTMDDARLAERLARPENDHLDPMLLALWGSEQNDWWKLRRRDPGSYYDDALEFLVEVTGVLHRSGVDVLAGSDAGLVLSNVIPGWALHRELEYLVRAGMTNHEALLAATAKTGAFLAPGSKLGTLQVGAPADLLLLRANPLEAIGNTRTIEAVVAAGEVHDRAAIERLLEGAREAQRPARDFIATIEADGLEAAITGVLAARDRGAAVPTEASLFVAAYHRAAAEDLGPALALADLACSLYPDSYRAALLLAGLYQLAGLPDARGELERALELCPAHPLIPGRLEALDE